MSIHDHDGKKYLRKIYSAEGKKEWILVDIYSILKAYQITCPALTHCCKKLLCAGKRGKGDTITDLKDAISSIERAIEMIQEDQQEVPNPTKSEEVKPYEYIPHSSHSFPPQKDHCLHCGKSTYDKTIVFSCTGK